MATKLKRMIYIGVGGTGIETVLQVKDYFKSISPNDEFPPMIKFLMVDTDKEALKNFNLKSEEYFPIAEKNASAIFSAHKERYSTLPNPSRIRSLNAGAGQVRSLGKFALSSKEYTVGTTTLSFSDKFRRIYDEVLNIHDENENFELLGDDVEVHIAFSLCGGTGSGSFLSIAYLIRQIVPTCKLFGYGFSHNFFTNLPTADRIKTNAYASLLELDHCMHADEPAYQGIKYPTESYINQPPFDSFMFIDNRTNTKDNTVTPYMYPTTAKAQVEKRVCYAMALSAGDLGVAGASVTDNIIDDIAGGTFNVTFSDSNEEKKGWVSSLGVSEIICKSNSEEDLFSAKLSIKILKELNASNSNISAATEAYNWVKEFELNESGDTDDHDAVVNYLVSPDDFENVVATEITQDTLERGKSDFLKRVEIKSSAIEKKISDKEESIKELLRSKIQTVLFPKTGSSLGIAGTIEVLKKFEGLMNNYKAVMENECNIETSNISLHKNEWSDACDTMSRLVRGYTYNKESRISQCESDLCYAAQEEFKSDCQLRRRIAAKTLFEKIATFAKNQYETLENFKTRVSDAITTKEEEIQTINSTFTIDANNWGTIDLTKQAENLETTKVSDIVYSLDDFFKSTNYISVDELAGCTNIDEKVDKFADKEYEKHLTKIGGSINSKYPIIRILQSLSDTELDTYLKNAANKYSMPLMDIDKFGEDVNVTEHIFIGAPGGDNCDSRIKDHMKSILGDTVDPRWIDTKDPNRLLIYRQIGVIPPYFITGVSAGRNTFFRSGSCQEKFENSINKDYVPFTDTAFDDAYKKKGFRLDRNKKENMDMGIESWVQCFILGLIERSANGIYRIEYPAGETLPDDPFRSWKVLGKNRFDAFDIFNNDLQFKKYVQEKLANLLKDNSLQKKYQSFWGYDNRQKYASVCLLQIPSEEYDIEEVQILFVREINFLSSKL